MRKTFATTIAFVVAPLLALTLAGCSHPSEVGQQPREEPAPTEEPAPVDNQPTTTTASFSFDWETYELEDEQWWGSQEALDLANRIVASQLPDGGWRKTLDKEEEGDWGLSTIDNNATWGEIRFLAKAFLATGDESYRDACQRGIDLLLDGQYENGGWPQIFGVEGGYHTCVTFNDDAMVGVMRTLWMVSEQSEEDGFAWVDDACAQRAGEAFDRGLECILRCQVVVDGTPTVWCQQYDPDTLLPAPGRAFEPVALCSRESVGVVMLLQELPIDDSRVTASVEAALAWFESAALRGVRFEQVGDDRQLVEGQPEDRLWARFYDLETGVPVFGDRDGEVYYDVADISLERRVGYDWYGTWPEECLEGQRL